jgi:capsule polysaccharide export protein KpsE/RkpR
MLGGALNIKNPSDVYVAMLKSRTIQDRLIDKFDLRKAYREKTYVETRKKLEKNTEISAGKDGVIIVDFEDKDATRARDVARAYVDALMELSEEVSVSEAGQRRKYFERELVKEKEQLADSEIELKKIQQSTGLIIPGEQARAIVESIARLRGMVAAKEVQIEAMKTFAAPQNQQLQQVQRELAELKAQLAMLEQNQPQGGDAGIIVPTGTIPEKSMAFIRKFRDFKYHEALYEMLAKQFELAKLEEAKDYAALQVLDWPVVADRKSKPFRLVIISLSTFAMMIFIVIWVLVEHEHRQRMRSPEYAARIARLRSFWSLK